PAFPYVQDEPLAITGRDHRPRPTAVLDRWQITHRMLTESRMVEFTAERATVLNRSASMIGGAYFQQHHSASPSSALHCWLWSAATNFSSAISFSYSLSSSSSSFRISSCCF